ncbi:MAG TPA: right-handed parallel beta-helix repeat-containing protein, partial [Phycisphaerae bacterium]
MALFPMMHVMLTWASALMVSAADIELSKDDTRITADTRIKPGTYHIGDTQADGAVQISGDGITVDFAGAELIGAPEDAAPDSFSGRGIVIRGKQITLRNAKVRGYKVGIYAENAPGLVIEDVDVSRNYQQRLKSTPEREDGADWLFPHNNDDQEWTKDHGAGISIARSDGITIRRVRAHNGQNGILLDRVNDSKIYDNDCSFLSGWGLGLWRCNRNVISRNAFDFCVRGYSHGVYNRGEDSAGILMFEQNNDNVIAENSATHGGDCFFGFAGREALGEDWLDRERERL